MHKKSMKKYEGRVSRSVYCFVFSGVQCNNNLFGGFFRFSALEDTFWQ